MGETTLRFTKRNYAFGLYLRTGWAPWGIDLRSAGPGIMPRYPGGTSEITGRRERPHWIMCCGHTMSDTEAQRWFDACVATEGVPTKYGWRTMVAGPNLEQWLSHCWHSPSVGGKSGGARV